jgi:exodeoxyribonuclease VII large subunit
MYALTDARVKSNRQILKMLSERRALTQPSSYIDDKRMALMSLTKDLEGAVNIKLTSQKQKFVRLSSVLEAVSPLKVISKGYSAVFKDGGKLVKSVDDLSEGDEVSFKLTDGSINAKVVSKNKA